MILLHHHMQNNPWPPPPGKETPKNKCNVCPSLTIKQQDERNRVMKKLFENHDKLDKIWNGGKTIECGKLPWWRRVIKWFKSLI